MSANIPQYNQYANNPYVCANAPASQVVMPQGQIQMPNTISQPPQVHTIPYPAPPVEQKVNYNQITPYLNTGSVVLQPSIQTKSGQVIATATADSSKPVNQQESQVVYVGPVKTINPQVTPVEQTDNDIEKQFIDYYKQKAEVNSELRKALKTIGYEEETPWHKKVMIALGIALVAIGLYKYRTKIPYFKKFFNK